jgi:phosphoribosylaminoimidazole (AIR) synthetase
MGIGIALIVRGEDSDGVLEFCKEQDIDILRIGSIG